MSSYDGLADGCWPIKQRDFSKTSHCEGLIGKHTDFPLMRETLISLSMHDVAIRMGLVSATVIERWKPESKN